MTTMSTVSPAPIDLASTPPADDARAASTRWTFLTNHAHVLLALYRQPDLRQRDIARLVGVTEGAVQRILTDLEHAGYLDAERIGRRNRYRVHPDLSLRHPLESHHRVGELLDTLAPERPATTEERAA